MFSGKIRDKGRSRCVPATLVVAATLFTSLIAGAAAAENVMGQIFASGHLDGVETADRLVYSHVRRAEAADRVGPDFEDAATLELVDRDGARAVVVTMMSASHPRQLQEFSGEASNPLLLAFLESSLRSVARATGGNPFYLRNRVKEAMRDGGAVEHIETPLGDHAVAAERITLRPFAADAHRAELGAFADLTYEIILSDAAPGTVVSLSAVAGSAAGAVYSERLALSEGAAIE